MMINLVLNAYQAMPKGGRLSIELLYEPPEAVVEITDTGSGIPEAHVTKIFDPFFTTGSDMRRSGLGLSVSHSIVRQHGGSLAVRTSSEGTVFTVRLPGADNVRRDNSLDVRAVEA